MASHRHKTIPREIMGNQRSCRCKFKTKSILEVPNMFIGIWLWMWEVDRVIFCPVAWSIPFSSSMGLPLLIISRLDWKSSLENCFSLAIQSSIPQKCRRRATFPSITPTGALSHAPFIEAEVLFASPLFFSMRFCQISKTMVAIIFFWICMLYC